MDPSSHRTRHGAFPVQAHKKLHISLTAKTISGLFLRSTKNDQNLELADQWANEARNAKKPYRNRTKLSEMQYKAKMRSAKEPY